MYSGATILFATQLHKNALRRLLSIDTDDWDEDELVSVAHAWQNYAEGPVVRSLIARGCPTVRAFRLPCCNKDGSVFLGIYMGDLSVAYRDSVDTFATFREYEANIQAMMDAAKRRARLIPFAEQEIRRIVPDADPKIYTFANDCSSCT